MCSLTLALTGLTTGLSMANQYQQSRAQAAAYEAQAQAANYQADAARAQAQIQRQNAEAREQDARIQSRREEQLAEQYANKQREMDNRARIIRGQNAAQAGAFGIIGNIGSGLDIYNASLDEQNEASLRLLQEQRNTMYGEYYKEVGLRNEAKGLYTQATNLDNQGTMYDNQAENYRAQASAAKTMGNWGMFGTLLGGATSMMGVGGGSSASSSGSYYASPSTGFLSGASATSAAQASMSGMFGSTLKIGNKMPTWNNYYGG